MGIQFGWALQMANMSAIYEVLGAKEHELALLWIAAPITGLIVQPIIGHMSDRTWCRFGRRRPYFFIGALLASIALVMMPHSSALWMAVGLLWILDASINITMEPFRAFVADMLPEQQRPFGFSVQTLLIGLGAVVSSALPWLLVNLFGVSNSVENSTVPDSVAFAFYIGAAALFLCVMVTILTTKEYPPHDLAAFEEEKRQRAGLAANLQDIADAIRTMPPRMKELAWVQMFTWAGLFCMWTYFAPGIARSVFGATEAGSATYQQGAEWAGVCFSFYNGTALLMAFALIRMVRCIRPQRIHTVSLLCGGFGLISVLFISHPSMLLLAMLGVGIAWASILAMPYALLADALPAKKMGVYMGVFNFFIVIPQVIVALSSGWILRHVFDGKPIALVAAGGASMLIAAGLTQRIR